MNSHFRNSSVSNQNYALRARLRQLRQEERRFMLALKDENNNQAMIDFCEAGLAKIRYQIDRLGGLV